MWRLRVSVILLFCISVVHVEGSPAEFIVPVENWYTIGGTTDVSFGLQAEASIRWGLQDALNNTEGILPNTEIVLEFVDNQLSAAVGIGLLIDFFERGLSFVAGNPLSSVVSVTGQAASVYGVAQLSGTANTAVLSDKTLYPFFSRSYVPAQLLALSTADTIRLFYEENGLGWDKIALLSTTDGYGISIANSFIEAIDEIDDLEVVVYQQFLEDAEDISIEIQEIARSGARVIVTYAFSGYDTVIEEAARSDLINGDHVWLVGPTIAGFSSIAINEDGSTNEFIADNLQGNLGSIVFLAREGERYERYLARWQAADPEVIPGSGPGTTPPLFPALTYDVGVLIGLVVDAADKQGLLDEEFIDPQAWTDIVRAQEFEGATGFVSFDDKGDRLMPAGIVNFRRDTLTWETVGVWEVETGTVLLDDIDIIWADGSTETPDLDIRPEFDYWSCDNKEMRTDRTGKSIQIHTPDGSSFDDIDSEYHCDQFIDCHNFSDESYDCSQNYLILFIIFGIITGLLTLMTCCFLPFIIIFGCIFPRKRILASSPIFLTIMALSGILGYGSTFAWYGKPHPVACAFQPWLLGLAVVSLISALCAKTWRIWRIFNKRFSHTVISDKQLVLFYIIMLLPAVLILVIWTIVSTPTASMEDRDGTDHYVCTTGGFTGTPGGMVFFFILVGYEAIVLLFGAFLSIVTRKVPMFFNESKLIAISIYNLGFLAIVVIPVFLILQQYNPFAAWIIRTTAILYAFTATLWLQFLPKVIGVLIIDKGKDVAINPKSMRTSNSASASVTAQ